MCHVDLWLRLDFDLLCNAVLVMDDGVQSPAAAGLRLEANPGIPGMRYQIHSESPIISNMTLKLDIVKGSASCGIAVGEVGEMGDIDTLPSAKASSQRRVDSAKWPW